MGLRPEHCLAALRTALVIALLGIFLYHTVCSVAKYLKGSSTLSRSSEDVRRMTFPGLTFCPMADDLFHSPSPQNQSLEEAVQGLEGTSPHYLKWFTQNHFDSWIDESPLWKKTVDVSVTTAEIVSCLTFATEGELKTGHSSALTLMTDATAVNYSVIFVHPRGDTFLGINQLYGRDHFILQRLKAGDFGRNFLFEIHTTKRTVLDKESLPCEGDDDKAVAHIRDCLDEAFEKKQGCKLPWRSNGSDVCSSVEAAAAYSQYSDRLKGAGAKEIFDDTGCYYLCTYHEYRMNLVMEDSMSEKAPPYEDDENQILYFYLAPGGLFVEEEVLVFDFIDLLGNIGGNLGLLVGASILSIYDGCKDITGKLIKKNKGTEPASSMY